MSCPSASAEGRDVRTREANSTRGANKRRIRRIWGALAGVSVGLLLAGCHTDMWVQPKPDAQAESDFWPDGINSRPPVPHAVDRDHLKTDDAYWRGTQGVNMVNGKPAGAIYIDELPAQLYQAPEFRSPTGDNAQALSKILDRGQERFNIYCSPCHGELGDGKGMIAQRGFAQKVAPRNYHSARMRALPLGHFYDVITNGYGAMTPRAFQVEPNDRWAIAAYIRVLQFSQNAPESDLTPDQIQQIDKPIPPPAEETEGGEAEKP